MFPSIVPGNTYVPSPWKGVRDFFVLTALFSALIAAVLTLVAPSLPAFWRWLLIVECIGLNGALTGTLIGRLPFLRRFRPLHAHLFISALAIPVAYVVGSSIAYTILDEPLPIFQANPRRIIAMIATGLAALFIVYLDAMRHRIVNEAAARMEAQRLATETQLRLLRAQLEPHMLFNTLANLRTLVETDPKLAQNMIDQVILYLRSTLAASREESATLKQEFVQLRAYLEIMALRMGTRMRYQLDLPKGLESFMIPPMLLQPLVENAIKHGIEPKIGSSEIHVRAQRNGSAIDITVADTGLGLSNDRGDSGGTNYGLTHVRDRLRAFYGPGATLSIAGNEPQGVRATVRIPQ
jgi:sensor histidine kinase YesM